jgi:hypothetical protein
MDFLTDTWITEFLNTHKLLIAGGYAVLRFLATLDPRVPNNRVMDWLTLLRKVHNEQVPK